MLILLTFAGDDTMPSFSPFCVKAMGLLRMSGQAWQPKYVGNPSKMPYGKMPVLKTDDGLVPDSGNIRAWLEAQGADFDAGLSTGQKAWSHAMIRMAEQSLYYGLVHDRWLRDDCWAVVRERFFGAVPGLMRPVVSGLVRRKVRRTLTSQGMAQLSEEDRLAWLGRDLGAIEETLGDQAYLFGGAPTAADASVTPMLDMIRNLPCDTGLRRLVRDNAMLGAYVDHARMALYPGNS